jgi:bacillithiol biosynthesis cysteine-adding enzyme BshC
VPDPGLSIETFRSAVDLRRIPWIRRLAADYSYAFDRVAPFFAGNPSERPAWADAIQRAQARPRPRTEVVALVSAQQERRGAPGQAIAAAQRLLDPASVAVVTGQQAGLFGGPLFTLLKALTALKLAAQVTQEHGVPAVAVFWVEAEDHDWAEIASCSVLDADLVRRTVTVPAPPGAGALPVASLDLPEAVGGVIDELGRALAPTEFTAGVLEQLRAAYQPGASPVDGFARWLEATLGPHGLAVYVGSDKGAKPLVRPVFVREIERAGESARLAAAAGDRLVALGYHAQVAPQPQAPSLFHLDGARLPILRDGETFTIGDASVSRQDLIAEADQHPERFSPNVIMRPIVQDALFPTVAYVAGPNELAYLAQLRAVYEQFDLPMPLIVPRASATLVDAGTARFLARYDVAFESLARQDESVLNDLLERQLPASVERAYQEAERGIGERMQALINAVPAIDPTLQGATRSALGRIEHDLQALHGKIIQAAKRRDETLRRQFQRTRAQAFPDGAPQERAIGWVNFLNRYGPALIERLDEELPLDPGRHWAIAI